MEQFPFKHVYDLIRHSIETGIYSYGSSIPSERILAEQYMVSRTTIRKAIDLLIDQGLLYRIPGKGTYVSLPRLHASNSINFIGHHFEENHMELSTNVFYSGVRNAGYKFAKMFQISEDAEIYQIFQQHCDQKIPYNIEYSYFPLYAVPNIASYDFSKVPLHRCLEDHHLIITHNHRTLDLVTVCPPQSTLLGLEPGGSVFMRKNSLYDINNRIIAYTLSYCVAEKYIFEIS